MTELERDERLAELEAENVRLRARLTDQQAVEDLRRAVTRAAAAGRLAAPQRHTDLLDQIVTTAAHVLHAHAASLFLIDEEAGDLVFAVALGEKAAEVKKFRVPLGTGLAGYVAATGQALAVSDVAQDPRWARAIGQAVDYHPGTLLAVPLLVQERVIGVLELLDRDGGAPFSMDDMQLAGHFAAQAAAAIEQSRVTQSVTGLLRAALADTDAGDEAASAAAEIVDGTELQETLRLASLLGEIGRRGEAEQQLGIRIVEALDSYLRQRAGE